MAASLRSGPHMLLYNSNAIRYNRLIPQRLLPLSVHNLTAKVDMAFVMHQSLGSPNPTPIEGGGEFTFWFSEY